MTSNRQRETVLLQPQGRLDLQGGQRLQQRFNALAACRYQLWIVDLSQVDFIDSSGLVALVAGLNLATEVGAELLLSGLHPAAQLIFDITQLDRAFNIVESYEPFITAQEYTPAAVEPVLQTA